MRLFFAYNNKEGRKRKVKGNKESKKFILLNRRMEMNKFSP